MRRRSRAARSSRRGRASGSGIGVALAAAVWVSVGAAAGVVESLIVALGHGYYFNTSASLLLFLLTPAAAYAVAGFLVGAALWLVVAVSARSVARGALLSASLCLSFFIVLFWGSALGGRFFGTVSNGVGHVAMITLAVLAFITARRLFASSRGRDAGALVLAATLLLLVAPAVALLVLPRGSSVRDAATATAASDTTGEQSAVAASDSDGTAGRGGPRPNILLVTIDTLRADRTGYSGYRSPSRPGGDGLGTTPRLDALAARGTVFSNAIVPAVVTDPSHASLLTAVPPWVHGVTRNAMPLRTDVPLISEALAGAGYATAAIASVEHLDGHISHMSRGFQRFIDRGWEDRYRHHVGGRVLQRHARTLFGRERDAARTAEVAARWLATSAAASGSEEPFFLWVHLFDPHMPYVNHETGRVFSLGERDAYAARDAGAGREWRDAVRGEPGESAPAGNGMPTVETAPGSAEGGVGMSTVETARAAYDSEVRHADTALGTILEALAEGGILENTLIVVTADHGEHMDEARIASENWFAHVDVYDEVARVPLVVAGPGVAGGERVERQVSSMDVAPTILELAGVSGGLGGRAGFGDDLRAGDAYPNGLSDGRGGPGESESVARAASAIEPLVTMANPHRGLTDRAVRNGRWKLIERRGVPAELYDLAADPDEMVNIIHAVPPVAGTMPPVARGVPPVPDDLAAVIRDLAAVLAGTPGLNGGSSMPEGSGELDPALQEMLEALGYVQ